jgi:hypothetical protein
MATGITKKESEEKYKQSEIWFSLLFSFRKRKQAFKATMLSVYICMSPFELLNQLTDIHAIRWALCHWVQLQFRTFQFPAVSNNEVSDIQICEIEQH